MIPTLRIQSVEYPSAIEVSRPHERGYGFTARLLGPPVDALLKFSISEPLEFSLFFASLARDWDGWTAPAASPPRTFR